MCQVKPDNMSGYTSLPIGSGPDSKPRNPCQWLEEALVEAFSLRGLGKLADSWEERPPFTNDAPFAESIRQYRRRMIENYEKIAAEQVQSYGIAAWFGKYRASLEREGGVTGAAQAVVNSMFNKFQADERSIEDLSALNRWPGRTSVSMENYLQLWQASCHEIGASGSLPKQISDLLGLL